nr:glycosyltransferase [Pseudoxanthomonas spadix]
MLRIIPSIDPRGGGPMEVARRTDGALAARGVHVEVVCLDSPNEGDFLLDYPVPVHPLGPSTRGYRYQPRLVPWLKENRARFDAVIVDGLWQYHGLAAWRALAGTDTPYFVFPHGMLDPWFKHTYPLKHLKKWLYWPWAEYRVLRGARAVLFTCEEEKLLARKSFWLYRANEEVISLGTVSPPADADGMLAASFRARHPELHGKRIVLFLSRIHEKKGCDLLVEAFARVARDHPDLHLVMAGPDQTGWAAELKRQAQALGIAGRITWPGMLQGDEKWGAFHAAEVFCLPSHQENFGIVVAEALGCGKPVLISNKVNIWREVEADGAGIVRDDTLEGTEDAMRTWLSMSEAGLVSMSSAARNCFDTRYRIEQVAKRLIEILHISKTMPAEKL